MKHPSHLRSYIVLFALGPGLVCTLLIGAYLTYALVRDITQYENSVSTVYSQQVARQAYRILQENDKATLEKTAQLALEYPLLRAITFYDNDRKELAHAGPLHAPMDISVIDMSKREVQEVHTDDTRQLFIPIMQSRLTNSFGIANREAAAQPLGWVRMEYSQSFILLHKYRTALIDVIVVIAVFAAAFWFAIPFGDRLAETLKNIAAGTRTIDKGDSAIPLPSSQILEIQDISTAIKEMHDTFASQQESLQQHIEQSTQDLRETLETIEIQNIELDLARREAVQASKIKSEFLANTSHEIRTPLNSIIGFSKLLLKTSLDTQQQDYLHNIRKSSAGLLTLINDVLDLSKIEAGKLVLDYTAFDISETLEEVLQILAPGAHEKGLELAQIVYSDVPKHLLGDPLRLKQVLTNLIGNAIKFSEEGMIAVRIAVDSRDAQQTLLKIEVSDNGKGLPNNKQEIFSAFTQLDSTSTRKHTGTGLGLAISQKIVRQMGGDIGYHSEPGNTTFWFTVRLDIAGTVPVENACTLLQDHHILVYDKEKLCRLTNSHLLTAWGAQPVLAESIEQILPAVEHHADGEHPISALLMSLPVRHTEQDIQSLIHIATLCQQRHNCPTVFCIPATAKRHFIDRVEQAVLIQKPVIAERLHEMLCQVLHLEHCPQIPASHHSNATPASTHLVLAVDDNAPNLKLISTILQGLGATVLSATNGEEAVDIYKANPDISVIFMDVQMPVMDGIEATQKIRYLETINGKRTAIVALTAHALAEQRQHMMAIGMDDFLSKPASEQQLLQMLSKWGNKYFTAPTTASASDTTLNVPVFDNGVDRHAALQACGNRPDAAAEMLTMLFNTLEADRAAITKAVASGDMALAREHIHKLHGASCYCGVANLKNCCDAMETLIKKDMTEHLPDVLARFHQAVDTLLAWQQKNNIAAFFST
jgi:two-component system sensor histidine kinase BarA